jgi:hypothetical protein
VGELVIIKVMRKQGRVWRAPEEVAMQGPLVFLAGPIQGSRDWQAEAIAYLHTSASELHIADPRREKMESDFDYAEQVDWETAALQRAGREGVILFWLAKEVEHDPKRAFAQTSRVEFGEWMVRASYGEAKLVVGIEPGFPGGRYIRYRLAQMLPDVAVSDDLEVACKMVLRTLGIRG